jgi:nicotinate-nucleotide pyrophosphorylase (carboxylating)
MKLMTKITPALRADLERIVTQALAEDIGAGDITSQLLIPATAQAHMLFVAREPMVACGVFVPGVVYGQLEPSVQVEALVDEGQGVPKGAVLAKASGPARAILTGERVTLNLMLRMCGVATITREYVEAVRGTKAIIIDTRKTMPGLRMCDKYAVVAGGGQNHRMRLDDMVLVKDNHIAIGGKNIRELMRDMRAKLAANIPVVIECDTLEQLADAIEAKPDRVLLDNMPPDMLRKAVALTAGRIKLEASGGVSLQTVRAIAESGVDYISVGKLTHSAPSLDIGADIEVSI